jgi:hypothetical protein
MTDLDEWSPEDELQLVDDPDRTGTAVRQNSSTDPNPTGTTAVGSTDSSDTDAAAAVSRDDSQQSTDDPEALGGSS